MLSVLLVIASLSSPSAESHRIASAIVDAAIARRGQPLTPLSFRVDGTVLQLHQSRTPRAPFLETRLEQVVTADPASREFRRDETSVWPYFTSRVTSRADAGGVLTLRHGTQTYRKATTGAEEMRAAMVRLHPDLLLDAASRRRASLRSAGRNAFLFSMEDSSVITVGVHEQRITTAEWLRHHDLFGDVAHRIEYAWKKGEPAGFRYFENDRLVIHGLYSQTQRGSGILVETLEIPAGYAPATDASSPVEIVELRPGVSLVRNAGGPDYHSLLIAFERDFVVIEGPRSTARATAAIAAIRKHDPSRPIRAVVVTHHHDDHIGGIRAYAEAGAQIITTAGNVEYLRSILAAPHTIQPAPPLDASVVAVRSGHRIADATNELILLNAGPTDHAEEVLVAWLPKQQMVFQGDLFRHDPATPEAARDSAVTFADFLEEHTPGVKTIAGVHGEIATPSDLQASIARRAR